VEAIRKRLEAAFLPHRCFVNVSDDQFLDFEVTTLMGDPVAVWIRGLADHVEAAYADYPPPAVPRLKTARKSIPAAAE
jgi:hypothetical protein